MSREKPRILISGVGRIGGALAKIIAPTQHAEIAVWDVDTKKISHSFTPTQLAAQADFVLLCLPSSAVREFVSGIASVLAPDAVVVSLVKGLDEQHGATMAELLTELLPPGVHPVILGGPMLSGELEQGKFAYGAAGCDPATFARLTQLFAPTILRVEQCADMQGVSVVGVLKNVYALGLGVAAALDVGDNVRGWLVTQALAEMHVLLPHLGGQADTVFTLAGVGDFVATAYSQHSRNRTVGHELVARGQVSIPSEGLITLPILRRRLGSTAQQFPFLQVISDVVLHGKNAQRTFGDFIAQ